MQHARSRRRLSDRLRKVLWPGLLAASALIVAFATSCDSDSTGPEPLVRESVGKASSQNAYVAIVVLSGASAGESEVIGYVCNGIGGLSEFFQGLATGGSVDLRSEDGDSRLRATLTDGGANGTIDIPGGITVTFNTISAVGSNPAGLFVASLYADGQVLGNSWGDKRLELLGSDQGYAGNVVLPNGSSIQYTRPKGSGGTTTTAAQIRLILLPDGSGRGAVTKTSGSTNKPYLVILMFD